MGPSRESCYQSKMGPEYDICSEAEKGGSDLSRRMLRGRNCASSAHASASKLSHVKILVV